MEGSLFLQFEEQQAHPHLISQLGVGDLTGDTSFFSSQHHFDISCKAQTDCKIMVIRGVDFLSLFTGRYEGQETILNNLFAIVSRKISTLRDKVHLLSNPAARQRSLFFNGAESHYASDSSIKSGNNGSILGNFSPCSL